MRTPFWITIIVLCALLSSRTSIAQQVSPDTLIAELSEVILAENRLDVPFSKAARSIQILESKDLVQLPLLHFSDALFYVPGIDVRRRGPNGVQSDLSIRGGTFDQSLVLLNGIRLSDPQTGHHTMNVPVDLSQIERIEIIRGPAARIYGQNAFAGAVNIVTRKPTHAYVEGEIQAGQTQFGGIRLSGALPSDFGSHQFSLNRQFSQGYRYNTDYDIQDAFYQWGNSWGKHTLELTAGMTERKFGANGFYANPDFAEQYEEVQTSLVALAHRTNVGKWIVKPRVYWRRNQDEYIFIRNNPSVYRNLHLGNSLGMEVHLNRPTRLGPVGVGVEWSGIWLASNNLGQRERQTWGGFLEQRMAFFGQKLSFTPGLYVQHFSDFGTFFYPGAEAGWHFNNAWQAYANGGLSNRIPTFTDQYYEDPLNVGNPDLEPETALTWELGLSYRKNRTQLQGAWFTRRSDNLIDWVKEEAMQPWRPVNAQSVVMEGFELLAVHHFTRGILRQARVGYAQLNDRSQITDAPFSRNILQFLNTQANGGVELGYRNLSLNVQASYTAWGEDETAMVMDARLMYVRKALTAFVDCTNLLNYEYVGANLVPMPGRLMRVGVRYHLRWVPGG